MAKSIFGIQEEYFETMYELEVFFQENPDHMGEIPDEYLERLNINKDEMVEKLRNYELAIRNIEAEQDTIDKEIARLKLVKAAKGNVITRLKGIMVEAVEKFGITNGKTHTKFIKGTFINHQARYLKPVVFDDENFVPKHYKRSELVIKENSVVLSKLLGRVSKALTKDKELKQQFVDTMVKGNLKIQVDKKTLRKDILEGNFEETEHIYIDVEKATLYLMKPSASKI